MDTIYMLGMKDKAVYVGLLEVEGFEAIVEEDRKKSECQTSTGLNTSLVHTIHLPTRHDLLNTIVNKPRESIGHT